MTKEEYDKKLAEARKKFGKPFATDILVSRKTEKSARLREIEAISKPRVDKLITTKLFLRKS